MKAKPLPSLKYLRECFTLDPTCPSGLRWNSRPLHHFDTTRGMNIFNKLFAGKPAGCITKVKPNAPDSYYWVVRLIGGLYYVHRVVYSMSKGILVGTDEQIDHKNLNGLNNNPINLRLASHNDNSQNQRMPFDNTSGIKGVYYNKRNGTWWGRIKCKGIFYYTGSSPSKEVIGELVRELRESLHGNFTRHT